MPRVPKLPLTALRAPVLGGLLVLLVGATAIAANRPPEAADVSRDGTLRVLVVDWLGAAPKAVAGADVEVAAVRDGLVLGTSSAITDEFGVAALSGLPRATAGSPVELHVAARQSALWVDADGCARGESVSGEAAAVTSVVGASVELQVSRASSMMCGPAWDQIAAVEPVPSEPEAATGLRPGVFVGVAVVLAALLAAAVGVARLRRRTA